MRADELNEVAVEPQQPSSQALQQPEVLPTGMDVSPHVEASGAPLIDAPAVFEVRDLNVYYGSFRAVRDVALTIPARQITAFIGPSGCGKTTVLRCFNRMNDLVEIARVEARFDTTGSTSTTPR